MFFQPLEQFEFVVVYYLDFFKVYSLEVFITNYMVYLFFLLLSFFFFFYLPVMGSRFIGGTWQLFVENLYKFVFSILYQQTGLLAQKFYPFVFTLFVVVFLSNLLGLTPFSFTVTSHLLTTFTLSFIVFLGLTILGFARHHLQFLNVLMPSGLPLFLALFLVVIETISYFSRMFSLSIRLFANMMSGHALLFILSAFVVKFMSKFENMEIRFFVDVFSFGYFLWCINFLIPWFLIILISTLEIGICCLQAYVFAVLFCIYLNDSFNGAAH